MKNKTIYFDMDGTIADLYNVDGWLTCLKANSTKPYEIAKPLVDLKETNFLLRQLKKKGYKICIISWLSKDSTKEYDKAVKRVKKEWLKKHFSIKFDSIDIIPYGTPKELYAINKSIIFDDDERVRKTWKGKAINPIKYNINKVLENML